MTYLHSAHRLVAGVLLAASAHAAQLPGPLELRPRQVAADAADILDGTVQLPAPSAGAVRCRGALFELSWQPDGKDRWRADAVLPVAKGPVGLAVQAHGAAAFQVEFALDGQADLLSAEPSEPAERRDQVLPAELGGEEVQRWDVATGRSGNARVTVRAEGTVAPARCRLAVRDAQPLTAAAYVDTLKRLSNRELTLVAQVERNGDGLGEDRLVYAIEDAWAWVEGPGYAARLPLLDDGQSADGAAGDGRFGVRLPKGLSGDYAARVELSGRFNGASFLRTTRVTFDVVEPVLELTGAVRSQPVDARRLRLDVGALALGAGAHPAPRLQVSAEVWARDEWGVPQPMTWLSRIERPSSAAAGKDLWTLPLWLDSGWFAATGLRPPLELRRVRVQDPNTFALLASADQLRVPAGAMPPLAGRARAPLGPLAQRAPLAADVSPTVRNPGLVLCHGYCSSGTVWPNADFSQPKLTFADQGQNRSHDQFANRIASQAAAFTSFGVVGHSQGGAAALHLLTFYESPLDLAYGQHRIQSVGTPYQGTPLASLGFFACGVNGNMTPGGASTWLAGIPSWARAEVAYYTTANNGGACQFFTDLLLSNPEDGTTERSRGQLPGGQNMGHVTGWCHTTGMSDPAQYRDGTRNARLNAEAAR